MKIRIAMLAVCAVLAASAAAQAQTHSPLVTMKIVTADGQSHELTARDSSVATFKTKDGTEYEARPTVIDSSPFNRVTIAVFKSATAKEATTLLGEGEAKAGGPAVTLKTKPAFTVSVTKVDAPK
jgi:ABC-type glycerol-3-phosphate transport system substrate-binding protein